VDLSSRLDIHIDHPKQNDTYHSIQQVIFILDGERGLRCIIAVDIFLNRESCNENGLEG
jgi:hypothetical protein